MSDWQDAKNSESQIIRWDKEDKPEIMEKTIYIGETIQGIYLGMKSDIGSKKGTLLNFKTEEHGNLSVWMNTVLGSAFMEDPAPQVGNEVKITYKGIVKTKDGKNEYKDFDVKYREAPMKSAMHKTEEDVRVESGEDTSFADMVDEM